MIEIRTITVQLGEREFSIREAGFMVAKPWKKRLLDDVKPLFGRLQDAPNMQFNSPADLFNLFPLAESVFVDGIATIFELLIDYSPALQEEREYIANYATDRQILAAFREVVTLADPFGVVATLDRQIGRLAIGTSSSLPQANGVAA